MSNPIFREHLLVERDGGNSVPIWNDHQDFFNDFPYDTANVDERAADEDTRLEFIRFSELEHMVQSRPTPLYRYGNSFSDWLYREQCEYHRQLGSTRWNLERPIYLHPLGNWQSKVLMLKRIRACIGWAVHGLLFEFLDDRRVGHVSDVEWLHDDEAIAGRRPTDWVDIEPGDYVRKVHGFNLLRACFLCHTIHIEMASGRTISFVSNHEPWKGAPFAYELPENSLLHYVSFRYGRCIGLTAVETSMHLPIHSLQRVRTLPKTCQDNYRFLQLLSGRIDCDNVNRGHRPLGRDLWGKIFWEYLACYDLQDDPSRLQQTLSRKFNDESDEEDNDSIQR